jgi:tetratricopeptide (TPR) repeat protein
MRWWFASLLLIFIVIQGVFAARVGIAVFPLKNESGSALDEWVGSAIAGTMFQKLRLLDGVQVWDPVFLFQADSTGWRMESDSLAMVHRSRWLWDIAIGGSYRVEGDRLVADVRLFWATGGEDRPLSVSLTVADKTSDIFPLVDDALLKILGTIRYRLSSADSAALRGGPTGDSIAFRTFAAGYGYEIRGNPNAALTAYARAEEIDPAFAEASCRQGMLYRRANDPDRARAALERAVAHAPHDEEVVAAWADFLRECDDPAIAFSFIDANRVLLEKTPEGLLAIGSLYAAAGEYQRGIATIGQAVARGPSDLEPAFELGRAYAAAGDFGQACDIFNNLIRFRPDYPRYYVALGEAFRRAGRLTESAAILESALGFAPENPSILLSLAHTCVMLGWYAKAEQLLIRAKEASLPTQDIEVYLGVVRWYEGRREEASRCFDSASRIPATRQSSFNNLGDLHFLEGSPAAAIQAYLKADRSGIANAVVLDNLALAYQAEGSLGKAAHCYDRLLRGQPDRIDILVRLSGIDAQLGRDKDAERTCRRIIELEPDNEAAIRGLARVLMKHHRYGDALEPVDNYLAHAPPSREFMNLSASICLCMKSYGQALARSRALLRLFPDDSGGLLGVGESMYGLIKYGGYRDYDNALYALKLAGIGAPDNPVPFRLMGDLYADYKGYGELAIEYWKKALALTHDKDMRKNLALRIAGKQ